MQTDVQVCFEDMACWDCTTMGNLTCGTAPAVMPDTSMAPPSYFPLDGLLFVIPLLAVAAWHRLRRG